MTTEAPTQATETATATTEAVDTQSPESQAKSKPAEAKAQPDKAGSKKQDAETLRKLLRREKEDPNVVFTNAELDILDRHYDGKLEPAKKSKPQEPVSEVKEDESPDTEEKEAPEEKEEPAEEEAEEDEPDEDEESEVNPEAEAIQKELGAKNLKEALAKLKELRSKLGGKDAQTVAKLEKQMRSEKDLWADLQKGEPAAVDFVKRNYGLSLLPQDAEREPSRPNSQRNRRGAPSQEGRTYISEDAFIDPESAKLANEAFRVRDAELDELRQEVKVFKEERERIRREATMNQAKLSVIDEMVQVAQRMDALKGVGNLREAISDWYDKGKPDTRLEVFNELFEIAKAEGCNLQAAALIKRGNEAERLIREAEERGRKAAYGHKPNPSLSGSQGGKGEMNYQQLTDAQLEAMENDHRLMPPDWFDKDDRPVQNKIPKKAWPLFGFARS